jgi:hypothetical protein
MLSVSTGCFGSPFPPHFLQFARDIYDIMPVNCPTEASHVSQSKSMLPMNTSVGVRSRLSVIHKHFQAMGPYLSIGFEIRLCLDLRLAAWQFAVHRCRNLKMPCEKVKERGGPGRSGPMPSSESERELTRHIFPRKIAAVSVGRFD